MNLQFLREVSPVEQLSHLKNGEGRTLYLSHRNFTTNFPKNHIIKSPYDSALLYIDCDSIHSESHVGVTLGMLEHLKTNVWGNFNLAFDPMSHLTRVTYPIWENVISNSCVDILMNMLPVRRNTSLGERYALEEAYVIEGSCPPVLRNLLQMWKKILAYPTPPLHEVAGEIGRRVSEFTSSEVCDRRMSYSQSNFLQMLYMSRQLHIFHHIWDLETKTLAPWYKVLWEDYNGDFRFDFFTGTHGWTKEFEHKMETYPVA